MKFDDKSGVNKENQRISPQSAMDAYFDDMFGSVNEDPLKKLESQDKSLKLIKESTHETACIKNSNEYLVPEPKRQLKEPVYNLTTPQFDEPALLIRALSPLIIPAAFPTLAPAKTKREIQTKPLVDTTLSEDTHSEITKTKLDSKTALAFLNKQRSKLSIAQKQRLKEKLKSLAKAKIKDDSKIQVKPAITKPKETAISVLKVKQEPPQPQFEPRLKTALDGQEEKVVVVAKPSDTKLGIEAKLAKNKLPDWADKRFECLLFSVAGLKLAVPLVSLGAIYKIEKDFIPLVGRASWFMGLYHHLERNVRVIDTAQWVMPERCSDEVRSAYKFIIRLGGNDWGMACDAVHQSIQLDPDQIKWRSERTKRAWLFGTVIDHMCALIDVDSLSALLEQQASTNPSIFP
tara:strand:+ start:22785 stop:23996 length:1212 start_codon:yes stop_codon:yes gene_type:complete